MAALTTLLLAGGGLALGYKIIRAAQWAGQQKENEKLRAEGLLVDAPGATVSLKKGRAYTLTYQFASTIDVATAQATEKVFRREMAAKGAGLELRIEDNPAGKFLVARIVPVTGTGIATIGKTFGTVTTLVRVTSADGQTLTAPT